MMRGTKVGDAVAVKQSSSDAMTKNGTIVSIDKDGLRCVATAKGYVYAVPDELHPATEPDRTVPVQALKPGQTIILFNGMTRTVDDVVAVGTPKRYRVLFRETDKVLSIFRSHEVLPGERFYVVDKGKPRNISEEKAQ